MGDINNINWVESQNTFSKSSRKIFGRNIYYNYFKDYQKKRYEIGRFRYSIDGGITILKVDKELDNDGIDSDGKAYYWHYFHNSCSFEKNLDYDKDPKLKSDRFIVNRLNSGKWNFNHNAYANITRAIAELKTQLNSDQSLIVFFPSNKLVEKDAQKNTKQSLLSFLNKIILILWSEILISLQKRTNNLW